MFGRKRKKELAVKSTEVAENNVEMEQEKIGIPEKKVKETIVIDCISPDNHVETKKVMPEKPDNIIDIDIANVKNLQIGYQAETLLLKKSLDDKLHIHEYIGYTAYEYLGKVTSNRFKTTVRYGRREEVNRQTYVEIYLPESWEGELTVSSQYGHITSTEDWKWERFTAETNEGNITFKTIEAPRIRLASPNESILVEHAIGFTALHTMSGAIVARRIDGGAKLESSSGPIEAVFSSVNNLLEAGSIGGDIHLTLPKDQGLKVDGISKTGTIENTVDGLTVKEKPGKVQSISGMLGDKPFFDVRISTINGNIHLD